MANKVRVKRSLTTGNKMPNTTAADVGELGVNIPDGKLYMRNGAGVPVLIGALVTDFSATRRYDTGDIVIRDGVFLRASSAVAPGAFNPAQWDAIGGGNAQGAILQLPDTATRNTINLLGKPTFKGLVIQGDSAQTANLFEVPSTNVADTRMAAIDATGFPVDRFAVNVFRVSQASHPFLYRGQPVAFDGGAWVPADASNPARACVAVVEQRIDDNTFVLRTGGRMTGLQTAAFSGGSIVTGQVYYVSGTEPGKLTATPNATRPDPVMVAIGGGNAIVVAGAGTLPFEYVSRAGDTMTGHLTMGGQNEVRFGGTATAIYKQSASPSLLFKVGGNLAGRVDEIGMAAGSGITLMTRDKGDFRYLTLSGGTMTGLLTLSAAPTANLHAATKLYVDQQVGGRLTQAQGDARYVRGSGDTMTGLLTLSGAPTANLHAATKLYVDQNAGISQAQGDARYALRSLTLTGGTGIVTAIGNLTANRTITLDTGYTDGRYLNLSNGKGGIQNVEGRVDVYSQTGSGIAMRVFGAADALAMTLFNDGRIAATGDISTSGVVSAGGNTRMLHSGTNAIFENSGAGAVAIRNNGTITHWLEEDGGMSRPASVATRASGDARWVNGDVAWDGVGSTVLCHYVGSANTLNPGAVVSGSTLRASDADGGTIGGALPGAQWVLCGALPPGAKEATFRRLS